MFYAYLHNMFASHPSSSGLPHVTLQLRFLPKISCSLVTHFKKKTLKKWTHERTLQVLYVYKYTMMSLAGSEWIHRIHKHKPPETKQFSQQKTSYWALLLLHKNLLSGLPSCHPKPPGLAGRHGALDSLQLPL